MGTGSVLLELPLLYYAPALALLALIWWAAGRLPRRADRILARGLAYGLLIGSFAFGVHDVVIVFPFWSLLLEQRGATGAAIIGIAIWSALGATAAALRERDAAIARRSGALLGGLPALLLLALAALVSLDHAAPRPTSTRFEMPAPDAPPPAAVRAPDPAHAVAPPDLMLSPVEPVLSTPDAAAPSPATAPAPAAAPPTSDPTSD